MKYRKIKDLKLLERNPRTITAEDFSRLKKSIKDNADYFEARPLILSDRTGELIILAGNQRYKAAVALRMKEVPTFLIPNLTEEREKEITIRDNVSNGRWDWETIANEWDLGHLEDWGVYLPGFDMSDEDTDDSFSLPDGDREPFQQMTFTMADEQAEQVKGAITKVKQKEEFKNIETFGNENSNGNALYLIISQWDGQKK